MCDVQCVWCECVRMSMCEHMHNDVHVITMYKGERVGLYLSHPFVTVFCNGHIINRYILYYKKPLMGHIMETYIFPSNLVSFH